MFLKKASVYLAVLTTMGVSACSIEAPDMCYNKVCSIENGTGTCNRDTGECEYECNLDSVYLKGQVKCVQLACLMRCPAIADGLDHGQVTCEDDSCVYTCDEGYVVEQDKCIRSKPEGECSKNKCESGLVWQCEDGNYSTESDKCKSGVCADGEKCAEVFCQYGDTKCENGGMRTCRNNAWEEGVSCERGCSADKKVCADDPCIGVECKIENGTGLCNEGKCAYSCNDGYKLNTTQDACVDKCAGVTCSIENGRGTCDKGVCKYTCDDGYNLNKDQGVCVDKCAGVTCSIENGTGTCNKGVCKYTCDEGYQMTQGACEWVSKYKPGDHLKFGEYEQDNVVSNGAEAIEWRVLAVDGKKVLIISEYIIESKLFNDAYDSVSTWPISSLRTWLNDDFYNKAFNTTEKPRIQLTHVQTPKNPYYPYSAADTDDYIFLLSNQEANSYFSSNEDRMTTCTPYAWAGTDYDDVNDTSSARYMKPDWWLRTVGINVYCACVVGGTTGIAYTDGHGAYLYKMGVRPAMWIIPE